MDPFDLDPLPRLRMEGRRFVAREGQSEFLHPDHYSERTPEHQEPIPDAASARATRVLAVKLIAMAMVMLGLLAGVIVIFT